MKICNQLFVKDIYRDKSFMGTVKCVCCGEQSNLNATFPFEVKLFTNFVKDFVRLHKGKGCNKVKLEAPEWASSDVSVGIAV